MPLAKVDIANDALRLMGATELTSLSDGSPEAARINAAWNSVLEYCLSRHPWSFALQRVILARAGEVAFGYKYQFAAPSDALRIVSLCNAQGDNLPVWTVEGAHLLCNVPQAFCLYVMRQMDVSRWSSGFAATLSAYLAFVISKPLDRTEQQGQLFQIFQQRLDLARLDDTAHQRPSMQEPVSSVLLARLPNGLEAESHTTQCPLDYSLDILPAGDV